MFLIELEDDDTLYRRLAKHQINPDGTVNSSAFKIGRVYDTEISVDVARLTCPQESVDRAGRSGFRLGAFEARVPRRLGLEVTHDPLPDNPAHALMCGGNDQKTSRALARGMKLIPGIQSRDAN